MTAANTPDIGYGTILRVGATLAATTATVAVGRLQSVNPPPYSRDVVDITGMDSPGHTREFIPGLIDRGEVAAEIVWVPGDATDDLIQALLTEREPRVWEVAFPQIAATPPVCNFRAFITGWEPGVPMEDKMTASITLKVTGVPTWTGV
ncbi:phage tail tube protein [Paragemmobacter ruber]|uniref:Phage tail protein n=1 Tax=Paragemmobacter ruber TaxID=1985673 RepID=A0ABW9Y215_9RHOB|nr:phage tail tube protein [Rhodobacter ruber]NBE05930.1 phage tail protein [Rhodobacter ruber]